MFQFINNDVHIFIVDDDELQLKMLKTKFISDLNKYKLKTFLSGEDFLEHLRKYPPRKNNLLILLLDYYLKTSQNKNAKDGIEILQIVKEKYPDIEVVVLSAYEDETENIPQLVKENGAIDFIKKNENSYTLIQNLLMQLISKRILGRKRFERNLAIVLFLVMSGITALFLIVTSFMS